MIEEDRQKYKNLPLVPESVLKRRHDLDELKRKRQANPEILLRKQRQDHAKKQGYERPRILKPETILAQARSRRGHERRYRRVLKKGMQKRASNKPTYALKALAAAEDDDDDETAKTKIQTNSVGARFVFCIRIRDHRACPRKMRALLEKFRLRQQYSGVFIKYTEETRKELHLIEPFVLYGQPSNMAVVADLIERRGFGVKMNEENGEKERIPLSDNTVIETALSEDTGILCKQDLVQELWNGGEHFDEAAQFLAPFLLADFKTRFERKTLKYRDGKMYGDCGEEITDYIRQVL